VTTTATTTTAPKTASTPISATPVHEPLATRLRWQAKDALVLTRRGLQRIRHEPMQLSDVTFQPVIFVLLFAYVFGSAMTIGAENYKEFLVAGLFGMIIAQTAPGTTVGIATDMTTGVIDRFRSLPMSRSAVLAARTMADTCTSAVAVVVVGATGYVVGWRINNGIPDALFAFALLLLFAFAISWCGACLGMVMTNVETAQATAFMIFLPLTFVSNAFVPTQGLPGWLQPIANWNPISAVAAACRDLFGNPNPSATIQAWPMQHPIEASIAWSVLLIAVFAPLAVRLYQRRAAA
jgi:ABC-2 type transport system permease protein